MTPTQDELGTARKPVYNATAFMWLALLGIPGLLLFLFLSKTGIGF